MNSDKKNDSFISINVEQPDELKFVDDDIRKEFEGKIYIARTPSLIQLSRKISILNRIMKYKKSID